MEFLQILHEREKLLDIDHDNPERSDIIRHILAIHTSFSYSLKIKRDYKLGKSPEKSRHINDKYLLNVSSWNVVQLAFIYMDSFLAMCNISNNIDIALACYILAYRYENDDNSWGIYDYVVKNSGPKYVLHMIKIEKYIWEYVLKFRMNLPTPIDFIDDNDAKKISTKLMMTHVELPSVIAKMSLALV
jgi:hypothetical protein